MSVLLTLGVVHLLAVMTPGPDSLLVSRTAAGTSRRAAMFTVAGITLGNMVWAALALVGLHVLLERVTLLQTGIKVLGGGYLVYLGVRMVLGSLRAGAAGPVAGETGAGREVRDADAFQVGFLTNLANVKAVVYFASIFATFVTADMSVPLKGAMFALTMLESFAWFTLVAFLLSLPGPQRAYRRAGAWIDRVAGGIFALFGLRLLLDSVD